VEFIWSGNSLSDDGSSFLSKIIGSGSQKTRKSVAINQVITGILLLIFHILGSLLTPESDSAKMITPFTNGITYYAVVSLIAMAYILVSRPFVTPEIKSPKCHFCNSPMKTAKLVCDNCESDSNKGKV